MFIMRSFLQPGAVSVEKPRWCLSFVLLHMSIRGDAEAEKLSTFNRWHGNGQEIRVWSLNYQKMSYLNRIFKCHSSDLHMTKWLTSYNNATVMFKKSGMLWKMDEGKHNDFIPRSVVYVSALHIITNNLLAEPRKLNPVILFSSWRHWIFPPHLVISITFVDLLCRGEKDFHLFVSSTFSAHCGFHNCHTLTESDPDTCPNTRACSLLCSREALFPHVDTLIRFYPQLTTLGIICLFNCFVFLI